jgi:hypothetical protein
VPSARQEEIDMQRARRPRALLATALVSLALPAAPTPAVTPEEERAARLAAVLREVPDDPPAERRAVDDPAARSAAGIVPFGSYVSIQVNVDALGQNIVGDAANEPSIAVNPTNADNLVIGWRQFDTIASNFRQAGWAYTFDHGQTWTFPGVLTPGVFRSDPVLDFDSQGSAFYQSLLSSFFVDVFKSTNDGVSWGPAVAAFGGDKNWMAIDRSGGGGDGHIYGIWQAAVGCCGNNIFTRSADGGASFEPPVPVAQSPGIGTMAVGPDGEVYATGIRETSGQDLDTFVVARSTNAENPAVTPTFTGVVIDLGGSLGFALAPNPEGLLGQPNVAVDPASGAVYVLGAVDPVSSMSTDPMDVHFVRSLNGGASWSAPRRITDDPPNLGHWHWMAAMSVAPNGRIDAVWYDTRNTREPNLSQLFYAWSWDQGQTWSQNVQVSPTFDTWVGWPQQSKIGDYSTMVSDLTGADVAYAATFNGEQDVYCVRVFPDCNANGVSDVADIASFDSSDCNANHVPDECDPAPSCVSSGRVPDGVTLQGAQLLLARSPNGNITLSWGKSCLPIDTDYGIYEGQIGVFPSHAQRTCTTGGAQTATFAPPAGDAYYIVVPHNTGREGSYGRTSDGDERPAAGDPCLPQQVGPCFGAGGLDAPRP